MSEQENYQFLPRALFLGIVQLCLVSILLGRMYYLQIYEGSYYHLLAEGNRIATRPLLPLRGQILDRNGIVLAQNETTFRILLLTDKKDEVENVLETLSEFIDISDEEKEKVLRSMGKKRGLDSTIIKENLTWGEVSAIELHAADLPGISVEVGATRRYPLTLNAAHLLGYVAAPSEKEQDEDAMMDIPGIKIGKAGVEKLFENQLRGAPGYSALEVNARRKIVRELNQVASTSGEDVHLTIDARLQDYAQEVLSAFESASAVVIDIQNGDIITLVSSPSFDPNLFPEGISHKAWGELQRNPYVPLTNKAVSGLYPPGSTVKLFVALAALQAGVINKDSIVHCPGFMYVGNHKFHCYRKEGHGTVNVSRAITESCDVFFYEAAKKVGIERLSQLFKDIGLGAGGLEGFPHSKVGLVPTKEWKQEKKNAKWTVSDTVLTSIGQGYVLATPLELATAVARLARGGEKLFPRLTGKDTPAFQNMGYDSKHIELILKAMADTSNSPSGTAFRSRIPIEGMEMGGKTGTSQVRRITMQDRQAGLTKTTHLPWKYREHGLFIAFAPIHSPRYAIAVVIEHAGGSSLAAQAARDILTKTQSLEQESPL